MVSESAGRAVHAQLDIRVPRPATDCLVALTDVSERKRSHVALERVNQELEARVAARTVDLETRNRQLEAEIRARVASEAQQRALESRMRESDRFQSLGLLAAGIAHDFNNLLVGVLGNAELLLLTPGLADRWRVPLSLIKRAGQQASDLTRQLLVFAGMGQLTTASVNLPRIVTESLEFLRTRLPQGIQLQAQITADLPAIEADRSQISQIVINLVTNAIEAVDERGVIVVQTRAEQLSADTLAEFQYNADIEPGEFAMLRVQDCGPGIDASTVKRIFDPFFSTKFAGRGLGLATVLGIVQAHRGALRVRSKPGEGTSFDIAFPLAAARVSSERPDVHQDQTNLVVGSGPVLLIDDDDSVRAVVGQLLALLGFEVTAANSGQAGLDLFCRGEPSFKFVVLDWMMPGLSGEQVLGSLRELKPALPVILISGYNAGELAANDGNVVRVQKPMTLARLRDAVCSVIDAQRVSA
jgi:signal transduction histidine kinase/CheY-like chemotaxis protein